jgi:hypothetical protein
MGAPGIPAPMPAKTAALGESVEGCEPAGLGPGVAGLGGKATLSLASMPRVIATVRLVTLGGVWPLTAGGVTTTLKLPRSMPRKT